MAILLDAFAQDIGDPVYRAGLAREFASALPFPHLVLDGLFAAPFLRSIESEFAGMAACWRECSSNREHTWRSVAGAPFGPATSAYFDLVHRNSFVAFMEAITGTNDLVVDQSLHGGGMHEARDGGWFDIHRDFNRHPRTLLHNEMVVLTYLNEGWNDDFGGHLEVWCHREKRVVRSIAPELGRTVILKHGQYSFHGHTRPVATGGTRLRRSVACYYYRSKPRLVDLSSAMPTVFALDQKGRAHPMAAKTLTGSSSTPVRSLNAALRMLTPPVIWNYARYALRNLSK